MRNFQRILTILGAIAAVVILGVALGWWGTRRTNPIPDSTQPQPGVSTAPTGSGLEPKPQPKPRVDGTAASPTNRPGRPVPSLVAANVLTNWEDKVEEILTAEGEDTDKAKKMLEIFPNLPEEGKVEVAQHLSNLVPDEDYGPLGKLLTDSSLSEDVLDVLLADVLNRPNSVKLPLLMEVARDSSNPKASEAKDLLELFLEDDYGTDWAKWQAKMDVWLKENPD
jgi:hypothetical protein